MVVIPIMEQTVAHSSDEIHHVNGDFHAKAKPKIQEPVTGHWIEFLGMAS